MCKISSRQWRNKPRWFWAGFHKYLCLPQMEGVFLYCVCQSERKYCGMCSHSWSIDSTAFPLASACQETRLLPFIGCSTAAICGQKKKIASQLRISLICPRCCQPWFAEYDNANWHYQLLSETCGMMWGNEACSFSGGNRALKTDGSWFRVGSAL